MPCDSAIIFAAGAGVGVGAIAGAAAGAAGLGNYAAIRKMIGTVLPYDF